MTLTDEHVPVLTWTEPEGIACRGTLVVVPGRGEQPAHYERFGRRAAADGYRVHAVADPAADPARTVSQVSGQRPAGRSGPAPGRALRAGPGRLDRVGRPGRGACTAPTTR
jgi:hypothetical protein